MSFFQVLSFSVGYSIGSVMHEQMAQAAILGGQGVLKIVIKRLRGCGVLLTSPWLTTNILGNRR